MVLFEILAMIKDTNNLDELKKSKAILQKTLQAINSRIGELEQEQLRMDLKYLLKKIANE